MMAHLRLDFLLCDCCGSFWCMDHSPGPMAEQRDRARGWGRWVGDRCEDCAASCPKGGPCALDVADQVTGFDSA